MPEQERKKKNSGTTLRVITRGNKLALAAAILVFAALLHMMLFYTVRASFTQTGACTPEGNGIAVHQPLKGVVTELLVDRNEFVEAGTPLLRICPEEKRTPGMSLQEMKNAAVELKSEVNGFVSQIEVREWQEVDLSMPLLYIAESEKEGITHASVMLPASNVAKIREGTEVTVQIEGIPEEDAGIVNGLVTKISKVPWTAEQLFRRTGSMQVAEVLCNSDEALFHVEIELDDSDGNGVPDFTKGMLPEDPVICWRMCDVTFYSDEVHPYQFLFASGR